MKPIPLLSLFSILGFWLRLVNTTEAPTMMPTELQTENPTKSPTRSPAFAPSDSSLALSAASSVGVVNSIVSVDGTTVGIPYNIIGLSGTNLAWLGSTASLYSVYRFSTCPTSETSLAGFSPSQITPLSVSATLIVTRYGYNSVANFGKCYVVCPSSGLSFYSDTQCTIGIIFTTSSPTEVPTFAPSHLTPTPTTGPTNPTTSNPTMFRPPVPVPVEDVPVEDVNVETEALKNQDNAKHESLFSSPVVQTVAVAAIVGSAAIGIGCMFFSCAKNRQKELSTGLNENLLTF